jgi:hypothetical protein
MRRSGPFCVIMAIIVEFQQFHGEENFVICVIRTLGNEILLLSSIILTQWQNVDRILLLNSYCVRGVLQFPSLIQTVSHNVVSSTPCKLQYMGLELTSLVVISTDCTGSCKSNYHTITTTTAPNNLAYYFLYSIQHYVIQFVSDLR